MRRAISSAFTLLLLCHCSGEDSPADAGQAADAQVQLDTGVAADAGQADTGFADAQPEDTGTSADAGPADTGAMDSGEADAGQADAGEADAGEVAFTLTSAAYAEGGAIPQRHSCGGEDLQPELSWSGAPAGTMSFAIVLIDESIDFTHWVAYDIPAGTSQLPEGASDMGSLPSGTQEARAYCTQFCGPCPRSQHTYTFEIFALDMANVPFGPRGAFGQAEIDRAYAGHILGRATLTATYTP